ncbi:MAG TPA: DUF5916 domain-containing protein [Vicinamibacterales bacterium]
MVILLVSLILLLLAVEAEAQSARPEIRAYRLAEGESIVIDGAPDEAAWQNAPAATNFLQRDPDNGEPASEKTEVRVLFDRDRIVLGVTCFDSEPNRLLGNQMQRDQSFESDDRFMFAIDPFFDGRSGYFFEINPSGAMGDGLITSPTGDGGGFGGEMNKSWDGIWLARVRRTAIGWTAEIEIPFKTVNFNPDTDTWGANFQRTVKRKNEESLWTGWLRDEGLTRMSNAGRIAGIDGISQGLGLDLKPYMLGSASAAPGRNRAATIGDFDIGLDAFYNVTPALKANLSINTDFAETEVDERRTNLTRFPLFFEEKREFFLDGANFFEFPGGEESPFFSRRIGLNAGTPQPILYGAKLVGQASRYDIGVLQVRTSEEEIAGRDVPLTLRGEDFTVARVKRRFGSQSHAGMLYTRRATHESVVDPQHTAAADVTIATPDFVGGSTLDSGAWYVHTSKPQFISEEGDLSDEGRSDSWGWHASVSKDPYDAEVSFREVQPAYNPAVGFTPRRNYRSWNPEINWSPRFENHRWLRGVQLGTDADINTSLANHVIDRNIRITPMELEFHSGDSIEFQMFRQTENLDEDFEISDGVILPAGNSYDWLRYQLGYDSAEQRMFSGRVEYSFGDFWDGKRKELTLDLNIRPRPGILIQLSSEFNDVDLPGGAFTTKLYGLDARTQFSPWISLSNNLQYDTDSGELGWQLRFRWIQKPGNDVFFIWTQNWQEEIGNRFASLDRRGAAKIVRTIRF